MGDLETILTWEGLRAELEETFGFKIMLDMRECNFRVICPPDEQHNTGFECCKVKNLEELQIFLQGLRAQEKIEKERPENVAPRGRS